MNRPITILLVFISSQSLMASEYSIPERIRVLPVAFVATDQKPPTDQEQKAFLKHLTWTQNRYRELLDDSFDVVESKVRIVKGKRPLDFYRKQPEGGAPDIVSELLARDGLTRFSCPHVYCILLMNSKDSFPEGGGRSINGGFNTGGGMLYVSSWQLARSPNFQSTLQHELLHSFGLPHVDVYGYDMKTNPSIMSYNPAHHTQRFEPSATPGTLIPEDRRALALNHRVFTRVRFTPANDVPASYRLFPRIVTLGPMSLPDQPDFYPQVTTNAGEDLNTRVTSIVREQVKPSSGPGVTFDASCMWHSKPLPDGKAVLELTFPFAVRLTGISIHSQHSGQYHEAKALLLQTNDPSGRAVVVEQPLQAVDATVTFPPATATRWSLTLTAGTTRTLVIRGLQFFDGTEEICPHQIPATQ